MGLPEILSSPALVVFGFCLFALDCLTLNGFLFSAVGIAVVSIASAVSGTTSTFIFDVSFCSFFW